MDGYDWQAAFWAVDNAVTGARSGRTGPFQRVGLQCHKAARSSRRHLTGNNLLRSYARVADVSGATQMNSRWTSLEVAKLVTSITTPLAVVLAAFWCKGRLL